MTASDIAYRVGVNQNYLDCVLPALEQDGKLEMRGRSWSVTLIRRRRDVAERPF